MTDKLHEAQAGRLRQFDRIEHQCGGIADDGGVEMGIPGAACHGGMGVPVVDAVNAEQAEPAAVIGIDRDHEAEQQQRAEPERADAGRQAAGPSRTTHQNLK